MISLSPGQNPVSSSPEYVNASLDVRPPGSRRAASTGHIGLPGTPSRSRADSLSPTRAAWAPGMPLPPPPPGPPPGSRSQSMTRAPYGERSSSDFPAPVAAPAPRRPLAHGTTLGPVPPTPSDWVEEDDSTRAAPPERRERDLQIDTQRDASNRRDEHNTPAESFYAAGSFAAPPQDTRAEREDGSPGLSRASARRDRTSKGIRERRSESRSGRARNLDGQTPVESRDNPFSFELEEVKPSDLVLPLTIAGRNRRRSPVRSRPGSAKTPHTGEGMRSSDSRRPSDPLESAGSNRSTPRPEYNQQNAGPDSLAYTPPFSPEAAKYHRVASISKTKSPALPPKALPTPPPQHYGVSSTNGKSYGRSPQDFHTSVEAAVPAPSPASRLTPSRLTPSQLTPSRRVQSDHSAEECESFMHSAIGRHRAFAEREAAASSDRERVEMFTEFIVAESRIRRKRYSRAMEQMSPGIEDLLRGLFRPPSPDQKLATTDSPGRAMGSLTSSHNQEQEGHEPNPNLDGKDSQPQGRPESSWWNSYLPSLSPIASMDNSTSHDELSSRGRPASRWWESEGSSENGARRTLERTQREAKYMSLVRDGKSLQWDEPRSSPSGRNGSGSFAGPSGNSVYGPNEYPPEKAGLPDSEMLPPPPPPKHPSPRSPPGPKLDVSRLVTLPPPYPRHYPAVNNNHPDLAAIRTTIRSLCPLASVKALKENYVASVAALREDAQRAANRRRSQTRSDIQRMIQAEEISFAEAAQIEADCEAAEIRATKERAQAEFDLFQKSVFNPSHASLSERIDKATTTIGEIRDMLTSIAQKRGPDLIQEEGDEHPELLEKLTQWKWCFETRELLYRELNDLQGERDDKFKAIVTAPYLLPKHAAKLAETEAFFARDAQDRKLAFEKDVLGRYEAFLNAMEDNVSRGVEVQLDAFYDIAPALLVLVQSIPPPHPAGPRSNNDLASLDIVIPACEYDENPAYHAYPLQYLHSLLTHAGRSMYTYIEAQTDLLCLLHEIKTAMMSASVRVVETERIIETQRALGASASNSSDASAGSRFDSNQTVQTQIAAISKEMEDIRREEERRVTDDLKDKVRVVEGLWEDGLGRAISDLKIRVRDVLVGMGGWEPGLDEAI
ncbi:MAG: hypothetical protein M1819_005638 [Sarea resinae]|nr:MAG: hypothetical protein M1819_005638 [Sarea resinae]